MMLCEALMREFQHRRRDKGFARKELLELFLETKDQPGPFSLPRIVEAAQRELGKPPGEWFRPSTIVHLISLLMKHAPSSLSDFQVIEEVEGAVHLQRLSQAKFAENCKCIEGFEIDEDLAPEAFKANKCSRCDVRNGVLLLVCCMLGLDCVEHEQVDLLKELLKCKYSVGMMSGVKDNALYIVGYQNDSFIVLDPHYVQDAIVTQAELQSAARTFVCETPRLVPIRAINPSVTFGFYLPTAEDANNLVDLLYNLQDKYGEYFCISLLEGQASLDQNLYACGRQSTDLKQSSHIMSDPMQSEGLILLKQSRKL
eukprot:TRINITY_DN15806_c0_g1_i2.p1 TRINITY_DN15806_c0_g1~~TRINITY_DN15806_c0_g1_i2.p1  ORF type:complete len:313 (-),score=34.80 TRINITY_DN15806_c0_g1_i2:80-1018(-)